MLLNRAIGMYLFGASRAPQPGLIRNGQVMAALETGDGRSIYIFIFVQIALAFGAAFQPEHGLHLLHFCDSWAFDAVPNAGHYAEEWCITW